MIDSLREHFSRLQRRGIIFEAEARKEVTMEFTRGTSSRRSQIYSAFPTRRHPPLSQLPMIRLYHRYLRRRYEQALAFSTPPGDEPTFPGLVSQLCTEVQMRSPVYLEICRKYRIEPIYRRKRWEYGFILQALEEHGVKQPGKRGLGFGVGRELLVAALASDGCSILATDQAMKDAVRGGWATTGQYAGALQALNSNKQCPDEDFRRLVEYRDANMNDIPSDLRGFDFVWSACALEHLGSLELGMQFIINAMDCLKPGGIAVHTTEYNLSSNDKTVDRERTVIYRRRDMEELAQRLAILGHSVAPFNFHPGKGPLDRYVDLPPYQWTPHLKLMLGGFAMTSIGIIVRKAP